jgi:hypothetical protein
MVGHQLVKHRSRLTLKVQDVSTVAPDVIRQGTTGPNAQRW